MIHNGLCSPNGKTQYVTLFPAWAGLIRRESGHPRRNMSVPRMGGADPHTIRQPEGKNGTKLVEVELTPLTAIVRLCRECLGFTGNPESCTSPNCPVFPFRTGQSHSGRTMSEEQRLAHKAMMTAHHSGQFPEAQNKGKNASEGPDPVLDTLGSA